MIGSFTTTDLDDQEQFRYGLVSNPGDYFKIVGNELYVNRSLLSQEDQSTYRIQVRSVDQSGDLVEQPFLIQTLPAATTLPEIRLTQNTVKENSIGGTIIGRLWTLDSQPSRYSYELLDDAQGRFILKADLLQVAPAAILDFETQPTHAITVRSWKSSPPVTVEQTFTIQVLNQIDVTVLMASDSERTQRLFTADQNNQDEVKITFKFVPELSHRGKIAEFMEMMFWQALTRNEIFMYRLKETDWVPWQGDLAELLTGQTLTLQNQHEMTLVLKPPFDWNQGELHLLVGYQLATGEIFYTTVPWP